MNPFEQQVQKSRPGTYKAYVEECIIDMQVNESKMIDVQKDDRGKFRMCISKLGEQLIMKFTTLLDHEGRMWVKRVE